MNRPQQSEPKVQDEVEQFIASANSIVISTISQDGCPDTGVAPFAMLDEHFVILVSELSAHTKNLMAGRAVSALIMADDNRAANAFARPRLSLQMSATEIPRDDAKFARLVDALRNRHGETVELLVSLPDFHAFALTPRQIRWISGFAKTYISENGELANFRAYKAKSG